MMNSPAYKTIVRTLRADGIKQISASVNTMLRSVNAHTLYILPGDSEPCADLYAEPLDQRIIILAGLACAADDKSVIDWVSNALAFLRDTKES